MNILVLDDDRFIAGYLKELLVELLSEANITHVVKEAISLDGARTLILDGFIPDLALVDYDLGPIERGTTIFPLIHEKNQKTFICLMTIRDRTPIQSADVVMTKNHFSDQLPEILHQAILKKK